MQRTKKYIKSGLKLLFFFFWLNRFFLKLNVKEIPKVVSFSTELAIHVDRSREELCHEICPPSALEQGAERGVGPSTAHFSSFTIPPSEDKDHKLYSGLRWQGMLRVSRWHLLLPLI